MVVGQGHTLATLNAINVGLHNTIVAEGVLILLEVGCPSHHTLAHSTLEFHIVSFDTRQAVKQSNLFVTEKQRLLLATSDALVHVWFQMDLVFEFYTDPQQQRRCSVSA